MSNFIWPLALIIISNTVYQICAKSVPSGMNPLASLTITYAVATIISALLYFILNRDGNLITEWRVTNWAPFLLGMVIVGLEVGYIYAYKVGWPISAAQIVQSSILAVVLIFVGYILYREDITWNKVIGILICLCGLGLINWK